MYNLKLDYLMEDKLKKMLTSLEDLCSQSNSSIFYGEISKGNLVEISWKNNNNADWKKYLEVIQKVQPQIIIVEVDINDIELDNEKITNFKNKLDSDEQKEYAEALKVIKQTSQHVMHISVSFVLNEIHYKYSEFVDWYDEYIQILESLVDEDYDDESVEKENNDSGHGRFLMPQTKELSNEEIEMHARKITSNEKYLNARTIPIRDALAVSLLREDNITSLMEIWKVKSAIDKIYETEIRPLQEEENRKKEEELKRNILALKKENLKKVEIASRLNVSVNAVNKFYYSDTEVTN